MHTSPELSSEIRTELLDLSTELEAVRPLLNKLQVSMPDSIEIRAVATTLHAFYNGVERICVRIVKELDGDLPSGHNWHRQLLTVARNSGPNRPPIIPQRLYDELLDYLGFRHFFRHSYPASLQWEQLKPLVGRLGDTHQRFHSSVQVFLDSISKLSPNSTSER